MPLAGSRDALWKLSVASLRAAVEDGDALEDAMDFAARLGSSSAADDPEAVWTATRNVERLAAAFARVRHAPPLHIHDWTGLPVPRATC